MIGIGVRDITVGFSQDFLVIGAMRIIESMAWLNSLGSAVIVVWQTTAVACTIIIKTHAKSWRNLGQIQNLNPN